MIAHSFLADVEARSDLVIVEGLGDDFQYLPLVRREITKSRDI
jgi:hypothetical protein